MAQQIATREVAGAVVTVVHQGRVLFARGYGFADVDKGVAVDAQTTLFRPGSVSTMFTWTALLQQVEAGRVSLEDDVNDYNAYTSDERRAGTKCVRTGRLRGWQLHEKK